MANRFEDEQKQLPTVAPDQAPDTDASDTEKRLGMSMLMKVALASVLIASLVISVSCVMRANQLKARTEELKRQIEEYNEEIDRLQYFLDQEVDEDYIIEYARDVLGMYFPDEDVYYNDVNE